MLRDDTVDGFDLLKDLDRSHPLILRVIVGWKLGWDISVHSKLR